MLDLRPWSHEYSFFCDGKKNIWQQRSILGCFNCVTQTIGRDRNRIWENQIHNCIVMCLSKQFCCCWAKNLRFHNNCSGYEAVWQNLVQRTLGTLRAGTFLLHLEVGHNIYCDDQGFNQSECRHLNRLTWLLWLWILLKWGQHYFDMNLQVILTMHLEDDCNSPHN